MASATHSSLNAHKSSMEPPPLPTIITSIPIVSSFSIPETILDAAPSPCTSAGYRTKETYGFLLYEIFIISWIAAPVEAVTIPIFLEK